MKLLSQTICLFMAIMGCHLYSHAQINAGGQPYAQSASSRQIDIPVPAQNQVPTLNVEKIEREDQQRPGNPRFAAPVAVDYSFSDGLWTELADGSRLWRMQLNTANSLALAILYDDFYLPPGARLFVYSPDYQQVLGAYTAQNNAPGGRFFTGFIKGQSAIIEYYEPANQLGNGRFHIFRVDQAYHKDNMTQAESTPDRNPLMFGFGTSQSCHNNANCSEGDSWEDQKRSTCRIYMVLEEGIGYCSGTLVNNTSEDETPYILSGYHCQDGYTPMYDLWRFDFNYQSSDCSNPSLEPVANSILGSVYRSGRQENDFLLLEITSSIPGSYNVFYAGWNRADTPPQSGVNFHHPNGDIKKVSLYDQTPVIHPFAINWDNGVTTPVNHHFRLNYSAGSYEIGSSGSALFNQSGQVVGQLHGGINPACAGVPTLYFGRLSLSWSGGGTADTRLSDWLDPLNLDSDSMDGLNSTLPTTVSMQGIIQNEAGMPIENVQIVLSNSTVDTTYTDENGVYSFSSVPVGAALGVSLSRDDVVHNGCSTFDLIKIAQHSLGVESLGSPYKMLAADVNDSGSLTPLDQIAIRKVIIGIALDFPGKPFWQFFPTNYPISDNPFTDDIPETYFIANFSTNITVDFIGVKTGDIDDSADTLLD
jgi:lysyl endopeptidase